MRLHVDEVRTDVEVARALLREQCPDWAELPLGPAGAGTDNTMYRLGAELLVRLPRTPATARALTKEQQWLPRLAAQLDCQVPEPVHRGRPGAGFDLVWSVYRWIDGDVVGPGTVSDWDGLGAGLAATVSRLRSTPLDGARRSGELAGYRGGSLASCADWFAADLAACRELEGPGLDLDVLARFWQDGLEAGEAPGPDVLLHTDLKPTNLLVRDGELVAVIDFGGLTVGRPDAEHATVWDLPAPAREAYRARLQLDETTWVRARAWAVLVGLSGLVYYRDSYPAFVAECRARLERILGSVLRSCDDP